MKNLGTYVDPDTGRTGVIVTETEPFWIVKWDNPIDCDYEQIPRPDFDIHSIL